MSRGARAARTAVSARVKRPGAPAEKPPLNIKEDLKYFRHHALLKNEIDHRRFWGLRGAILLFF